MYTNILGMGRRGGSIDLRKGGGWVGVMNEKITSPSPFPQIHHPEYQFNLSINTYRLTNMLVIKRIQVLELN